jgi:hypothetical protein
MNPKDQGDMQDDSFADLQGEISRPVDPSAAANDAPNEDIEDLDGPEDEDDRAGLL